MKKDKNKNYAVCLCDMDFLDSADNVYRTDEYIVKQQISFLESDVGTRILLALRLITLAVRLLLI